MRRILGLLALLSLTTTVLAGTLRQSAKTVMVTGKILSPVANQPIILGISRVGFNQEELTAPVDAAGNFSFKFTTFIPTDVWVSYQNTFQILVHPGDNLYLEFDGSTTDRDIILKNIVFKGDAAVANRSAASFQRLYFASSFYLYDYAQYQERIKNYNPEQFIHYWDSVRKEAILFQQAFVKKEKPGNEVATWSRLLMEDGYYSGLASYPESHRKALVLTKSEWDVAPGYFDFLLKYYDIKNSLIGGDAIGNYVSKYTYRYISKLVDAYVSTLKSPISNEQRDSIYIQSIVRYTKDPITREISLCFFLNHLLDELAIGTFEGSRTLADKYITQPFLREPLFEKYAASKKEMEAASHMIPQPTNTGVSFIDSIFQRNKGKVIYVDLWATWCGPCREEFPYSRKLEDTFGGDVVFLYLCLESNENAYQNLVKKHAHNGIYQLLDTTQGNLVKKRFHANGFPHYVLIGKNGEVAYSGFDMRPSADETGKLIQEMLKR